jgi:hypothetical protein
MFRLRLTWLTLLLTGLALSVPATPYAQARPGTLRLVVRDATDLTIPGATATLTAANGTMRNAVANERGEVLFEGLTAGEYTARVEFPGFTPADVKDLRVRAGAQTNRNVVMQIAGMAEEIEVLPPDEDTQLLDAFTEQMTEEQLAALPDDPDEVAMILRQLVGDDADIRVNGFSGGELPPGTQIQDIRIVYDAASGSGTGGPRIEIRTQPGGGRWRNTFNMDMRDEALNARNAFSGERPSGQTRHYAWRVSGPLVRNRTGISLSIDRSDEQEQQAIRAARPDGIFSHLISQPSTETDVEVELEHALTNTQELRFDVEFSRGRSRNQGVSEFDLPERAYSRMDSEGQMRVGHRATIRGQWVNDLRFQYQWQDSESMSVSDARTIRVLDAFTTGGAQISGVRSTREYEIENELEFTVKRAHRMEFGASISGETYAVDEVRNANGTFTFASLEMYQAGRPTTYTQRTINPSGSYALHRFGWYLQDNYRVSRDLIVSMALRHDMQTRLSDWTNFSPRVGVNWTLPGRRTTLRASFGVWPGFFGGGLYEETLWANGRQQRDIVISNPGYPDPFAGGIPLAAQPPTIVLAHRDIVMPYRRRVSIGADRRLMSWARLRASYSHQIGRNEFRSRDLNAPIDGVRPDPTLRNVTLVESTAHSLDRSLDLDLTLTHRPRRFTSRLSYTLGAAFDETDGPLALPPNSFDLSQEWGPSRGDVRHRFGASVFTDVAAGFRVNMSFRAQSGAPYNITTGLDENRDGRTNERPAGIGRNSGRGERTANLDMGISWSQSVGQRLTVNAQRGGGGGGGRDGGGGNRGRDSGLVRFEIFARASNVLNLVNAQNFSGVVTSRFFGRATSAAAPRRLVLGMRAFF